MARVVNIHPDSPQQRLLVQAADFIRNGAVVALPTDSCYALGCHLGDKEALDRIRQIRQIDERHHLTLMVRDLSEIAHFARVDNAQYRLLKATTPGSYTFILEGTKELPRRLLHPKRKTIGLRVPEPSGGPGAARGVERAAIDDDAATAWRRAPLTEGWEIQDRLEDQLELILDAGHCGTEPTTIIDLTGSTPELIRAGRGSLVPHSGWIEQRMLESLIQTIAIAALPVIFAITLHEAAHGYAARHFGDPTAWQMGRISLNPLRHIDLVGTIMIPVAILLFSGGTFLFGYAKPVPVDFSRLRNPKKDMLWVAAAGPGANLFMALCWAALLKLAWLMPSNDFTLPLSEMSKIGIIVNCVLMVLNLLPCRRSTAGGSPSACCRTIWPGNSPASSPGAFPFCWCCCSPDILGAVMNPLVIFAARAIESIFGLY
jgi:tRNA threonylcarbamoyl adenosine modification protein (Sua5/YciO/YrdC/YwlC family)